MDENRGYIGTDDGQLLYTTDAGLNWASVYNFGVLNSGVKSIEFSGNIGYAVSNMGRIAKTSLTNSVQVNNEFSPLIGFPNPCSDYFRINSKHQQTLAVFSLDGQLIYEKLKPDNQFIIPTKEWLNGYYVGRLTNKSGKISHFKILKQ